MANFWVIAPFAKGVCDAQVKGMVDCYKDLNGMSLRVPGGSPVDRNYGLGGSYIYRCSYLLDRHSFSSGDVLFLVAHGADNDTCLYSDHSIGWGKSMTVNECINKLNNAQAYNLSAIFFAICYSAFPGHCAQAWKMQGARKVYGVGDGSGGTLQNPISISHGGTLLQINRALQLVY